MRVTSNMSADNSIYNIQQSRSKQDRLQELASTQALVNRPSDDPINSRLLLDIGDKLKSGDQYHSNISKSSTWLQLTNTALTGMTDTLKLAKDVISSIMSGSSDAIVRQSAVSKLQALKQQIVDMANTQIGDQYLFGGANNSVQPYTNTDNNYSGDTTQLSIEIGQNTTQTVNITGDRLLKGTGASPSYGSSDILETFDTLIAAVNGDGGVGTPNEYGDLAAIQSGALSLSDGAKQVYNAQSDVAARVMRLDSMTKMNENTRSTLETIYSNAQNVDNVKLAVQLSQQKIAFEAALSTTAKLSALSLLDYMK